VTCVVYLLGIYYAVGGIGIGLGFLATSQFLKVYTHIKKPLWLTPVYSEWVGAWWLVYALGTCISLILSSILFLFDLGRTRKYATSQKQLPLPVNRDYQLLAPSVLYQNDSLQHVRDLSIRTSSSTTNPLSNETLTIADDHHQLPARSLSDTNDTTMLTWLKFEEYSYDIFSLMKHLLLNMRYMGITCCAIIEALLIKGYLAFLSKHIEYQFRTTSSHSSVYIGIISLFSVSHELNKLTMIITTTNAFMFNVLLSSVKVIFGTPLGAFCVKRFDMNGRQCAKFCCIILAMSSVIFLGLILHCREPTIGKKNDERKRRRKEHRTDHVYCIHKVQHIPCLLFRRRSTMIITMSL
jgi:hypothetical protein